MTISTGLSDFSKMIITVLKFSFIKLKAQETYDKDYLKLIRTYSGKTWL